MIRWSIFKTYTFKIETFKQQVRESELFLNLSGPDFLQFDRLGLLYSIIEQKFKIIFPRIRLKQKRLKTQQKN